MFGLLFFAAASKPLSSSAQTFSTRSGWGATPYSGGVTFRVWAPNASSVHVACSSNRFSTTANPLVAEPGGTGIWSVDVTNAFNGDQYKYYINGTTYKQDPRSRKQVSSTGNCYVYTTTNFNWAGDTFSSTNIPLNDAVVYELHCGSFYDPNSGSPGTFYSATNNLPFLKQLGVSVIEVMPIAEFPGNYSWGYNPSDIFGVESSYGGPDAFKTFVKAAHQLGMAVILDVIHNHYGPTDLDLWQFDGWSQNGYGGIYFYNTSGPCCTPYGNTRPNYGTQQVRNFIQDNFTMWLSECHVDGFRWDSPGTMIYYDGGSLPDASSLIQQISSMIHTAYVGKINIGEDQNQFTGTAGFDATWNGNNFFNNVLPQLAASSDSARNMASISYAVNLNNDGGGISGWGSVDFLEDHDQCGCVSPPCAAGIGRLPVRIDSSNPTGYYARKRSTLGSAITLTTAGIPMILEGEEMLTTNNFGDSIPLVWSLTNTYSGIVSLYTDLIRLRRNLDGRSSGLKGVNVNTIFLQDNGAVSNGNNKVIAYRRWNTGTVGDDVVVICNFANTSWTNYSVSGFPHTNVWYTQFNSDWPKYSSDYGNFGSLSTTVAVNSTTATISIAPYSALILSQNIPGAPPTPQNPKVTSVTTNQISFGWTASGAATGYIVKRGGSQIATTSTNTYTDTGLAVDVTYCYSVDATNIGGVSADSAQVCATTLPATGATNLLAYWTLDEGGGSFAYDYSGNSNTGTVSFGNSGTWASGMVNGALSLDGDGAQVTVPNSSSLNPVNGITIAAWVYDNSTCWCTYPRILEKGTSDNQYALFANPSGQLEFLVAGVSNGTITVSPPSSGAWHHLAATYDGSSLMSFYIDGLLATQQVASGSMPVTTDPLAIGNKPGGSVLYQFNGVVDDVRIYGSALPPAQIAQLYNIDSVGDGIPDWWRWQWFGSSSSTNSASCATCDYDGTDQNNFFKYVAGLNPIDPTQVFVLQIAASNQVVNLTFGPVVSGPTYTVESSPDLVNYSGLASNTVPQINGNQTTITDLAPWPSNEFYHVHISLP